MSELALQLIKDYKENPNKFNKKLDLGNCGLNENNIPDELSELNDLETLILSNRYYDSQEKGWYFSSNKGGKNFFSKIPKVIAKLTYLKVLICAGGNSPRWQIDDIQILSNLKHLKKLNLRNNGIEDIEVLKKRISLNELNLGVNKIIDISHLSKLKKLKTLILDSNKIDDIVGLQDLTNIDSLDLSHNNIANINFLRKLTSLKLLKLRRNKIANIKVIERLSNLKTLDLSMNKIKNIKPLGKLIDDYKLQQVYLYKNPIKVFDTSEGENYGEILEEYFDRQKGIEKVKVQLPVKVVLLGNHASGKSTFTNFFIDNHLKSEDSTHILRIENYPSKNKNNELPEAVFFDFGGQDYYHGLYRIYLSKYALNLIFWTEATNRNSFGTNDSNGFPIHNFSTHYWLSSMYFNKEYYYEDRGKAVIVKTHIDKANTQILKLDDYKILKSFSCCLSEDSSSFDLYEDKKHLKEFLVSEINTISKENTSEQPQWYIDFLTFLYNHKPENPFEPLTFEYILESHYERRFVGTKKKIEYLDINLKELHRSGIILYYTKEDLDFNEFFDSKTMHGLIWTNPSGLVEKLHKEIFNKEKILKSSTRGRTSLKELGLDNKKDEAIIELLQIQKVIFHHLVRNEHEIITTDEYILPNFLPLANEEDEHNLMKVELTQSNPKFILHFNYFLPFGLINQLICYFGKQPAEKYFWRDQIVFSLCNMAKILIKIDFQKLQIKVYYKIFDTCLSKINDNKLNRYIFFVIMKLYWDFDSPVRFIEYFEAEYFSNSLTYSDSFSDGYRQFMSEKSCQPMDLFLSIDNENFVPYRQLYTGGKHVMVINRDNEEKSVEKEIFNDFIEGVSLRITQTINKTKEESMKKQNLKNAQFKVAVSFPGEKRTYVENTVDALAKRIGSENIFYDDWYKAQLAQTGIDTILQNVYNNQTELVVVFLCKEYNEKDWCKIEWRATKDLINTKESDKVMLLTFDYEKIDGLYISTDGMLDLQKHTEQEVAQLIEERLSFL